MAGVTKTFPRLSNVMLLAPNGTLYAMGTFATQKTLTTSDFSGRDYFQRAVKNGHASWSDLLIAQTVTKQPVMLVGTPIKIMVRKRSRERAEARER